MAADYSDETLIVLAAADEAMQRSRETVEHVQKTRAAGRQVLLEQEERFAAMRLGHRGSSA
jgi:hypothetical protein